MERKRNDISSRKGFVSVSESARRGAFFPAQLHLHLNYGASQILRRRPKLGGEIIGIKTKRKYAPEYINVGAPAPLSLPKRLAPLSNSLKGN